jgi:hypothetical protein
MTASRPRWILAAAVAALGVGSAMAVLIPGIYALFASLGRMDIPGRGVLHLTPGAYSVYYESAALDLPNYKAPGISVSIEPKGGGEAVAVSNDLLFPLAYSTDHHGSLSCEFRIEREGDYEITVGAPLKKQPAPATLSVTRALGAAGYVRLGLFPFCLFWGGLGAGCGILARKPKPTPA